VNDGPDKQVPPKHGPDKQVPPKHGPDKRVPPYAVGAIHELPPRGWNFGST